MPKQEVNFNIEQNELLTNAVSTASENVNYSDSIPPNPLLPYNHDNKNYDIIEFLKRPLLCATPSWTTGHVQGTNLHTMSIPSFMLGGGSVWLNKLVGIMGFKGTFCFKVQFNCQRFQSGILLASILPGGNHLSVNRISLVESDIVYKSQLPSVRYNIAELDEVTIRVPFTSPELFYNRTSAVDWAKVYLDVYYPLAGGNIAGTCWCWFEDVELFHATPQSNIVQVKTKKRNVSYSDQEDNGSLLSTTLGLFSRSFGSLSSSIPSLSAVSKPTAWFLDAASRAAGSFGFSSTIDTSFRHAVVHKVFPHMNNCDTNDTSDSLGLTVGNKISHMSGFAGTDIDEMSIQYIAQIPSYYTAITWPNTSLTSTLLHNIFVHPCFPMKTKTIAPTTGSAISAVIMCPAGYVASSFSYWRGSMRYKFYMSKTDFHTGRLMFQFAPGDTSAVVNTWGNSGYAQKWVWDIQESNSFEILIPYVNSACWSSTLDSNNSRLGQLSVYVLTPLNAPTTVSTSINFIIEVSAGPDFEVSGAITNSTLAPIIAYSGDVNTNRKFSHRERVYYDDKVVKFNQNAKKKSSKIKISNFRDAKYKIVAQGPLSVDQSSGVHHVPGTEGLRVIKTKEDYDSFNALFTTGESVKSLRQLLKRTATFAEYVGLNNIEIGYQFNPFLPCLPYAVNAGTRVDLTGTVFTTDLYSKFAPIFALRRGGVIVRSLSTSQRGISAMTLRSSERTFVGFGITTTGSYSGSFNEAESRVVTSNNNQASIDALVPYYGRTPSMPVVTLPNPFSDTSDSRYYATNLYCVCTTDGSYDTAAGTGYTGFLIGRKVADDFSLGAFIGVLPLQARPHTFP